MAYTTFKLPIGYRLYDREQNKVVPLNQEEYESLERIQAGRATQEDGELLERFREKGFCQESELCEIEHPATPTLEAALQTQLRQIVLQVTQNCNLRCSYCAYSGSYYNRTHTNKRMRVETALRAVDFFLERSSGVEEVTIGFYGGEPVLEFDLIKQVIDHVEKHYPSRKVRYNFTTNLTLFTDEVIDYVLEKNIQIMISIDGPQPVQDKYRTFVNGKGSFATVIANARRIRERDPDYYQTCFTNTVASPGEDYESIREFLDHSELFGPLHSSFTQVNEVGLKEEVTYGDEYYRMVRREKFKMLLFTLGEIDSSRASRMFSRDKANLLHTYRGLMGGGTLHSRKGHPGGPCVPGLHRFFVDVDGNFYPCERITEDAAFQVGNLDTGFDLEKVEKIINVGRCTKEECLTCWAFLHCGTCIANMVEETTATREARLRRCPQVRGGVIDKLSDVEMVKYYGFDFTEEDE